MNAICETMVEQGAVMERMLREDFVVHEQSRTLNEAEQVEKKEGLLSSAWKALKEFLQKIKDLIGRVWGWVKSKIAAFWEWVKKKYRDVKYFLISKYMIWRTKRIMIKLGMAKEAATLVAKGSVTMGLAIHRKFEEEGRDISEVSHEEMAKIAIGELEPMLADLGKAMGASQEEIEQLRSMSEGVKGADPAAVHKVASMFTSISSEVSAVTSGLTKAKPVEA
jgi:hypothetical protein